jgi:hypothetical protein
MEYYQFLSTQLAVTDCSNRRACLAVTDRSNGRADSIGRLLL